MKLPPITPKQQTILKLIYRYRFIERTQIQKFLGHKDKRRISSWLKDLKEKHYLEWVYESEDFIARTKPAKYYLGINGIRLLKQGDDYPIDELRKRYRESSRSEGFQARCSIIADAALVLKAKSSESVRYAWLTQADYADPDSELHFLTELGPHFFYAEKQKGKAKANYMLEVFDATLPRYRVRNRLKQYVTYLVEGEWASERSDAQPTARLVLPTLADLIYAKRRIRKLLEDEWEPEDVHIQLTTVEKIKTQGLLGNIWEEVKTAG